MFALLKHFLNVPFSLIDHHLLSLQQYRLQIASHNKDVSDRLREVEENHAGQVMQYERKMAHLRRLLSEKQQALDEMASNKR